MTADAYFSELREAIDSINTAQVEQFAQVLESARLRYSNIFVIGNGGSAATAAHFANDLAVGTRAEGPSFRVSALTDAAAVTCIGNDFGYDEVFRLQLRNRAVPDDVVVAFSASGNSPNILRAVECANGLSCITVGLTGFDGGELLGLTDYAVHVSTEKGKYGIVEDAHLAVNHAVVAILKDRIASSRK